jgi:hypothetical protein
MRLVLLVSLAALSAGALSGCKPTPPADTQAAAGPAVDAPRRKPGLWKQSMLIQEGDSIQNVPICLDAASDAKLSWWGRPGSDCSTSQVSRQPDGSWKFQSTCALPQGGQVVTEGRAVGDFTRSYQVVADSRVTGAPNDNLNGSHSVTIDAVWQGDCPKGMKPGDMDLPNGQRVNALGVLSAPQG